MVSLVLSDNVNFVNLICCDDSSDDLVEERVDFEWHEDIL